jgi:hypothetical protein
MFIINWMFDKLGYMPKIDMQVGKLDVEFKAAWPFPDAKAVREKRIEELIAEDKPRKKPAVKKATTRKPATKKVK